MVLNPLNELKRRLEDNATPLPKRLCLAKNVVKTHHFPLGPKERVIGDWLNDITKLDQLTIEGIQDVLSWVSIDNCGTAELRSTLIEIIAHYVKVNSVQPEYIEDILIFITNESISKQLHHHITEFLLISKTLLHLTKANDTEKSIKIINNYIKFYRESKQKLQFIIKFIENDNLEMVFDCLDLTPIRNAALNLCQSILFPITKKSFFSVYLQALLREDNIDKLIKEKGDNIQSVLRIMDSFFKFSSKSKDIDYGFINKFINTFVYSYKTEHQLIFAFYIICIDSLKIEQQYIVPSFKIHAIKFGNDVEIIDMQRNIFLSMMETLLENDININIRLTDTLGEKVSKVEIKKTFSSFLQVVLIKLIEFEEMDVTILKIVTTALKIDPILIEKKMCSIVPPLMIAKKSKEPVMDAYKDMLTCLLETLFKLSRGNLFIQQMMPELKTILGSKNMDLKSKTIGLNNIFPKDCLDKYGALTTELMFRQNAELLVSYEKDFEIYCLATLEQGVICPSVILLTELMSSIICTFFQHCKMVDHTVPPQIAEEFWNAFEKFEIQTLKRFGECLLKFKHDPQLIGAYLALCLGYAQLKILNIQYCNNTVNHIPHDNGDGHFDFSSMLPCLNCDQWKEITELKLNNTGFSVLMNLCVLNIMYNKITTGNAENKMAATKTYLIQNISDNIEYFNNLSFPNALILNLNPIQQKQFAEKSLKQILNRSEVNFIEHDSIQNNKELMKAFVLEILKELAIILAKNNQSALSKAIVKTDFDISDFCNNNAIDEYFNQEDKEFKNEDYGKITKCIDLLKQLKVYNLNENLILSTIFVALIFKSALKAKKMRKNIDTLLQQIFELSTKNPDVFKLFPIDFMFSFPNNFFVELVTLKIKTSNRLLIVKMIMELAVKKVKTDSEVVRKVVKILLLNQKNKDGSSIEYFSNEVFQISCIMLPLIAKEKKSITTSAFRSILAELQEKMHKSLLKSFKSVDFTNEISFLNETCNTDESVISESSLATLNAMEAFSLTLAKYCETNDAEEIKNLDCLWSGLEYFVQHAITSLKNPDLKSHHADASIQLLNTVLRYIKRFETHDLFDKRDDVFVQIWQSLQQRLVVVFGKFKTNDNFDDIALTLKFLCELSSVECFTSKFTIADLVVFKEPSSIKESDLLTSHRVAKFLLTASLKSNIIGPKCLAIAKSTLRFSKTISAFLRQYYDKINGLPELDFNVCELLVTDLQMISEVVLAAKRISLNYKLMDAILDVEQSIVNLLSLKQTWPTYFTLFEACLNVLNSLLLSREELLEDRWPCYMKSYRSLVSFLCNKSTTQIDLERDVEEKMAEIAHSIEKLTQSMCKRKTQLSRLATYAVGDICHLLEATAPMRTVRQHLENSVALLIQISDSTYTVAFLRRALAGNPGHMTLTNLYTMYKRYHKYVGNS